eukprot:14903294-Alexandrium_andersonii.AAC.1
MRDTVRAEDWACAVELKHSPRGDDNKARPRALVEDHYWKSAETAGNCRNPQEPAGDCFLQ